MDEAYYGITGVWTKRLDSEYIVITISYGDNDKLSRIKQNPNTLEAGRKAGLWHRSNCFQWCTCTFATSYINQIHFVLEKLIRSINK